MNWEERCTLIPDGVSTYSKMPCRHVEGVYPETVHAARGAYLYAMDDKGNERGYLDYELGLGAVVVGHSNRRLTDAVYRVLSNGTVLSVPCDAEAELAQKIIDIVPCAEKVRFTVTGSEACQAAIKLARAYTGRERLLCCGYHGWFPFYSAQTEQNLGCTQNEKALIESFPYNDAVALKEKFESGPPPAAVIMEPYVLDEPTPGYLHAVRSLCDHYRTVLIFDEVVTGFRTRGWTAQAHFGVTPDLTCLGKCMSNGISPISCVCGKAEILDLIRSGCFISSTFAANPLAVTAALETISFMETFGVIEHIWSYGEKFRALFEQLADSLGLPQAKMRGLPCRTWFDFPTEAHKSLFWQECLKEGVWFGYAQFISYMHAEAELNQTVRAMQRGLDALRLNWNNPEAALEGKCAEATFRLVCQRPKPVAEDWKVPDESFDVEKVMTDAVSYKCNDCEHVFIEPYVASFGRYGGRPACSKCHRPNIERIVP